MTGAIRAELARRELARRHYRDYLRYVHGARWIDTALSSHLADRAQAFLETDTGNAYDVLLIETPPQHGKSMAVTESLPSWWLGRRPDSRVILAAYNDELAERFLRRNREKLLQFGETLFGVSVGSVNRASALELSQHRGGMIARGVRSGIGQAQYSEIEAARLKSRQAINAAQTKLAADTARQIAALRAKGEFQKADALLDVTQKYLSQLLTLEKWSANWENTQSQLRRSVEQWERSCDLSASGAERAAAKDRQSQLAASGEALLKAGVLPSADQLAAMGMTAAQAQAYIQSLVSRGKL